jgi:SNF2 family DNA or RNA helicase
MSTGFTLTATNRVVFNDLSWCPADNEQAEKRIHRIGQTKDCYVVHIVSQGIDRKIAQVLQEKQKTIKKVYFN